jgi:tetratricopeptide (TPR) repeat protein
LARKAARAREWDLAVGHYRKTLDRDPSNSSAWVQYGHALKESGNLREAEDAYRNALALEPKVADTHLQLGHALKLQGHKQVAAAAYLHALALDPKLHFAAVELVHLGWRMADISSWAMARFKRSLEPAVTGARFSEVESSKAADGLPSIVSDLIRHFAANRLPTGIQRVQINVVTSLLRKPRPDFDIAIACLARRRIFG